MGSCAYCGSRIWFGGVRDGYLRFCNQDCHRHGVYLKFVDQLPQNLVNEHVSAVHRGNCPKCRGAGPIDVHKSHSVWSAIILTSWKTQPQISCRKCATWAQAEGLLSSLILGWWGFPWGLIITPVQIVRNIGGMLGGPDPARPTPELEKLIKINLAEQILRNQAQAAQR
ncbi:MAG TPA: hypothetical protein VE986_02290 [Hyphomicrobiales bacterium]|nr:hypothetical protein [Hyphomicrobiales bacterium]